MIANVRNVDEELKGQSIANIGCGAFAFLYFRQTCLPQSALESPALARVAFPRVVDKSMISG